MPFMRSLVFRAFLAVFTGWAACCKTVVFKRIKHYLNSLGLICNGGINRGKPHLNENDLLKSVNTKFLIVAPFYLIFSWGLIPVTFAPFLKHFK